MMRSHLIIFIIFAITIPKAFSQSLNSLSGYFNIPTAEIAPDSQISTGVYYLPYQYVSEKDFDRDAASFFTSVTYLPFCEMSLRFTKKLGPNYALGDRMFSIKTQIISENKYLPSLAIGAQDFFHTTNDLSNRFCSLYFVMTKNIILNTIFRNISLTIGVGTNIIKASGYDYIGLFGGASFELINKLEIILEYDAKYFNSGSRIKLFNHIFLMGGFINMKYLTGGGGFYVSL